MHIELEEETVGLWRILPAGEEAWFEYSARDFVLVHLVGDGIVLGRWEFHALEEALGFILRTSELERKYGVAGVAA